MRLGRNATIVILVLSTAALAASVALFTAAGSRVPAPEDAEFPLPAFSQPELPAPRLLIPSEHERLLSHRFRPYREPRRMWTENDRSRFWIDPERVTADYLRSEGKKSLEAMFEAVP